MAKNIIFMLFTIALLFCGCNKREKKDAPDISKYINVTPYQYNQKERSTPIGEDAFFFKATKEIKATDLTTNMIVINQSGYDATAGDASYLQIQKNNQWETLPKSYMYTSIGYGIADGDSMSFNCDLDLFEHESEHSPGMYRLCKSILIQPEIQVAIDTIAMPTNRPNHSLIKISVEDEPLNLQKGVFTINVENRSRHDLQITELGYFKLINNDSENRYYVQTTTSPRRIDMPAHSTLPLTLPLRNLPNMNPFKPGLYTLHLNINVILTYEFEIKP